MNDESSKYYELLGVAPGTSGRELKQAYHDMAKVWHPDRFSHDPRLQRKAQEKLKEINDAYEQLTSGAAARRTRPASAAGGSYTPPAAAVRRRRPRFILPIVLSAAVVFAAAFFAALSALTPPDASRAGEQSAPAGQAEAIPAEAGRQPDAVAGRAADRPARGKERAGRQPPAEAPPGGVTGAAQAAPREAPTPLRPLPTVTVTIDAVNGLRATRDCPTVSRMTYPAGSEPRQYCTLPHKTKVSARPEPERTDGSRLKSVGKRLAAPARWLGGG